MSILRITLAEWSDVGIPAAVVGETVGTALTGTLVATPTADGTVIDSYGRVQQFVKETATVDGSAPFTYDLLDPTDCMPSDWGWRISVRSNDDKRLTWLKTELPFSIIESYPQVDGVRTIPLETVAALATGDPDAPWVTPSLWSALDQSIKDSAASAGLSAQSSQQSAGNSAASASNSADSAYLAGQHSGTAHDWANAAGAQAATATTQAGVATAAAQTATQDAAQTVNETFPPLVQQYLTENPPEDGDDGRQVELQTSATHVLWRYVGDAAWLDLIPLSVISGDDGLSAELQTTATHIQWRQAGGAWADLIPLASLVGPTGPANELSIGTVTTLAAGASATAAITGTAPNQTLGLGIPRGDAGSPTAFELRGTGMPNGVVTAAVATYYTDTAGTQGLWRWLKASGTGTTGWVPTFATPGEIVGAGRPDVAGTMSTGVAALVAAATSGAKFRSTDGPQGAWEWLKRTDGKWHVTNGDSGWRDVTVQTWVHETNTYAVPNGARAGTSIRLTTAGMDLIVRGYGGATDPGVLIQTNQHLRIPVLRSLLPAQLIWNSYSNLPLGLREYFGDIAIQWNRAPAAVWFLPRDPAAWPTALPGTTI